MALTSLAKLGPSEGSSAQPQQKEVTIQEFMGHTVLLDHLDLALAVPAWAVQALAVLA
jgi:hypothetical protein